MIGVFDVARLDFATTIPTQGDDVAFFGTTDQVNLYNRIEKTLLAYDLASGVLKNRSDVATHINIVDAQAGIYRNLQIRPL